MGGADAYCVALNTDAGQARKESLQEMRRSRGYLDHKGYVDMYEDYLSEYICKDEIRDFHIFQGSDLGCLTT